jgi:TRAP-type C4-dicarboxylate transport system permease small subunit
MAEEQRPKHPMEKFTIAGRLLIIATIFAAGGLFYWNMMFINDHFPSGHYPMLYILMPVLIGSAIFYGIFYFILRRFGVRICKDSDDQKPPA